MRESPAAHRRPMPPGFRRIGSTGAGPLLSTVITGTSPDPPRPVEATSPTRIDHGKVSVGANGGRGAPPAPGCRRNAIFLPSGDHMGRESRDVDGATNRIGCPAVYNPMKL